ncbi:hemerythrin domain-containing protein [Anthocerotibacter panamensis]|uniref:hemerythrin domain-containing protein n=1 Tax=Anthocerotibacter panamensis TaxID=2857077 RepID=UPI001C40153D|nr:hemerythrin domain-containing protein [Anthocerotibacter panamensis]
MVTRLDDAKRMSIAEELSGIKALQMLAISAEQKLLGVCRDERICERLRDFMKTDQKNLGVLENAMIQYGNRCEPSQRLQTMISEADQSFDDPELSLKEKFGRLELLKHKQFMMGYLVHKAGQVVGADIEAAIAPINMVNFENRAQQEQLKGILEIEGVRALTGREPDQSFFAKVMDAAAAAVGALGSATGMGTTDMTVLDFVKMDHDKAKTLFRQIEGADRPEKCQEYYQQVYKDLMVHTQAEEQTWYATLRQFDDTINMAEQAYEEQADMKRMLRETLNVSPSASEFKSRVKQIEDVTCEHIGLEENDIFPRMRRHFSREQLIEMGKEFQNVKSRLQERMARGEEITAS